MRGRRNAVRLFSTSTPGEGGPLRVAAGLLAALPVLGLVLAACGDGSSLLRPIGGVATLTLSPSAMTLKVGERRSFSVTAVDGSGRPVNGLDWSSSNPSVVSVDGAGTVEGLAPGSAVVSVSAGGLTREAPVVVEAPQRSAVADGGDAQTGVAGAALAVPLSVLVREDGVALEGVAVSWSTSGGGALQPVSGATGADGRARATWTLGPAAGPQTATAAIAGAGEVTFTATAAPGPAARVLVTPATATVTVGDTHAFGAAAEDAHGNPIPGAAFTWSSTQTGVATVDGSGTATGRAAGTAGIRATAGAASGSATLTVRSAEADDPAPVTDLRLVDATETSATLSWTQVPDGRGRPAHYAIRYGEPGMTWGSASGTESRVQGTATGQPLEYAVEGLAADTEYEFEVRSFRVDGGTEVQSTGSNKVKGRTKAAPGKLSLAKAAGDGQAGVVGAALGTPLVVQVTASGAPQAGVPVTWDVGGGGGSLSAASTSTGSDGRAQVAWTLGTAAGAQSVTASIQGGGQVTFTATARPGSVRTVAVTPATATLAVGEARTFAASAADAWGNPVPGAAFTWSTSNASVLSVSASGRATAVAAGSARVRASTGGVTGSAAVTVGGAPGNQVASVTVQPQAHTFEALGQILALQVTARDGTGTVLQGIEYVFASTDTSVARVDAMGKVTALRVGAATVVVAAVCCSPADSVQVVVTQVPASIDVTPATVSLSVGQTRQLSAVVRDTNGHAIPGAPVQWSSTQTSVASVDGSGKVLGLAEGAAIVRAASGSVTKDVPVEVTPPAALGRVTDLRVASTTQNAITLQWTEVGNGAGGPADYAVAYGSPTIPDPAPYEIRKGRSVGATASHTFSGLPAGAAYQFVVVPFRAMAGDTTVGPFSNAVQARTEGGSGGAAPIFSDGFESGGLGSASGGFSWDGSQRTDVTGARPYSGSRSLEFTYGSDAWGADSFSEQRFSYPATSQIWIEYWLYVPQNYRHRADEPSNNKFFRLFSEPDDGTFSLTLETLASGNETVSATDRFKSESGGNLGIPYKTEGTANVIGPTAAYPIQIGTWTRIRIHFHSSSNGLTRDGRVEFWANDTLVKSLDWDFWPNKGSGPVRIDRGYLLGWANSGFSQQTKFYIDDFKLWTSDPGW